MNTNARIWYTSDTHFGHYNIIRYCNRPFATTDEMDARLVEVFNELVAPDDIVYHLGDVAMRWQTGLHNLKKLNGQKHLIIGNHDKRQIREWDGWLSVSGELAIQDGEYTVFLRHYPPTEVPDKFGNMVSEHSKLRKNEVMLHGHIHSPYPQFSKKTNVFDVGVDANHMKPVRLFELLKLQERRLA